MIFFRRRAAAPPSAGASPAGLAALDAPFGVALLDRAGRIEGCNAAFQSIVGREAATLQGQPLTALVAPAERLRVAEQCNAVLASGTPADGLEVALDTAGDAPVVQLFLRRQTEDLARPLLAYVIDLSEQKRLEVQFAQSQKMLAIGQLAGGVAHDFNNLLTAMIGFCDLLLLRHRPGDPSFSDIMQIKQNANRASNLVRQLLAFSRQQTLTPRVLDVTEVLSELSHLMRRLIGEPIRLSIQHGHDLGLVRVDQGQLEQVLINLVVNARDAMADGGELVIRTINLDLTMPRHANGEDIPPGRYVTIAVSDTGIGIPPQNLSRIFEPFFSTKAIGLGTGLGLSTVYGIVRQTGGFIQVESQPGQGATFTILLPCLPDGTALSEPALEGIERAPADLTGFERILLVEDEDAVRSFSARALRNKGYEVIEAHSGEDALQLMTEQTKPVDLVVTDVIMPGLDGPGLVQALRANRPTLKVIYISGYTEDRVRDLGHGIGQEAQFLAKPFSLKQLAAKVKEVLAG